MTMRVTWEMDIDAESPLEAAQKAWDCMRSPDSIANAFTVVDRDGKNNIDLMEEGEIDGNEATD